MPRFLIILVALLACAATAQAQVVVTNLDVEGATLGEDRLRDILLGRITTWPDGSPIVLVLLDDPAASDATRHLTGRDLPQLIRGWKRLVYAGNGAMPIVLDSPQGVLDEVRRRPGAITVLAKPPDDPQLKVISPAP